MEFGDGVSVPSEDLARLFAETFTASEGAAEGALIGGLVEKIVAGTPGADLRVFAATDGGRLVGAILLTRLDYPEDGREVFLLAPVAVATDRQGEGIGQRLIGHALAALRAEGVDVVLTYGDPAFYGKVGFRPIDETIARAPMPLSMPEGWLGLALAEETLRPLAGPSTCVPAFRDPALW